MKWVKNTDFHSNEITGNPFLFKHTSCEYWIINNANENAQIPLIDGMLFVECGYVKGSRNIEKFIN